jgi:hypothetical protein
VSAPLRWEELDDAHADELTLATVPARLAAGGDPWEAMAPQSLEPLLEMSERDRANGLPDAPWPPVYPKQPGELPRVAPSRARKPD